MQAGAPISTLLLDTNVLLTALIAPERLPADVLADLESIDNAVLFSAASIWEISIKCSLGRPDFDFEPEDISRLAIRTGFEELPVRAAHCHRVRSLPWHHRDPFDRLLIAQTETLPARLLTTDSLLSKYSSLVTVVTLAAA